MKLPLTVLFAVAILFSCAASADEHHDVVGPDWIQKGDLINKMSSEGYTGVVAKPDDGHWEGEAVKDGRIVKFHADAQTGAITTTKPKTGD